MLDMALIGSSDARHIDQLKARLKEVYGAPPVLRRRTARRRSAVRAPSSTRSSAGRKGLTMQRLQGPGRNERRAIVGDDLDPNVRSLLQVKVTDATVCGWSVLAPDGRRSGARRDFIQENALSVANLDI